MNYNLFTSDASGCSLTSAGAGVGVSSAAAVEAGVVDATPILPLGEMLILGPGLNGRAPPPMFKRGL